MGAEQDQKDIALLRAKRIKPTLLRLRFLGAARAMKGPFTAEMLNQAVRPGDPSLSRVTAYRTLAAFADVGILEVLAPGRHGTRFEFSLGREHHDHLHCDRCGRVEPLRSEALERLLVDVPRSLGFSAERHCLDVHGICSLCSALGTTGGFEVRVRDARSKRS